MTCLGLLQKGATYIHTQAQTHITHKHIRTRLLCQLAGWLGVSRDLTEQAYSGRQVFALLHRPRQEQIHRERVLYIWYVCDLYRAVHVPEARRGGRSEERDDMPISTRSQRTVTVLITVAKGRARETASASKEDNLVSFPSS